MRSFFVVLGLGLGLAVAGCAAGSQVTHHSPDARPHARMSRPPQAGFKARLSAAVLLPSRTMAAGSSMAGRVVIENDTGRAIHTGGCITLFQVELVSASYHPTVYWTSCYEPFTIPTGRSSYRITVMAAYNHCSQGRPSPGVKRCLPHGQPPLPPGSYRAVLFQVRPLFPVPPAIAVQVTRRQR